MIDKLRVLLFLGMAIVFFSCKEKVEVELPYEEEKVIHILGDMHFAKSAAKVLNEEDRDSMQKVFEEQVFSIHDITKTDYENLKAILESDLTLFYDTEKKVNKYLKEVQNEKK